MPRKSDPLLALPDKSGVLYIRLYQRLRALILQGHWPVGTRLPSSRELAADLGISRNTATLAIEQLLADGLVEARSRAGVFVSASAPGRASAPVAAGAGAASTGKPPVPFELTPGAMDSFPVERWSKLQSEIWSRSAPNILYDADRAGDLGLRQAIASILAPVRGMSVDPAQVVIVSGTQSALDLIAAALGRGKAVVEDPGYIPGQATLAARGLELVHVPVDGQGLDVEGARRAEPNPVLVVTSPSVQFPLCVPLGDDRRNALLDWADESGAWIFEDDYDADARFDASTPPPPLREQRGDRVVTSVTFNRLLFRSLRLGFMVVPDGLRERLLAIRSATDEFINLPNQLVLRRFIEEGAFTAHLRRCRALHGERREALLEVLRPYAGSLFDPQFNSAGLHLVARPLGVAAETVAARLRESGIACTTAAGLSRLPNPPEAILLGFAAFSPDVIKAMQPTLHRALDALAEGEQGLHA